MLLVTLVKAYFATHYQCWPLALPPTTSCWSPMLATGAPTHYPAISHQYWPPALPPTTLLLVTNAGHRHSHPLLVTNVGHQPSYPLLVSNAGHWCSHPLPCCWSPMLATGTPTHYPPVCHQCWPPALPPTTLLLVTNAGHWRSHPLPCYWSSASHIGLTANKLPEFPLQVSRLVKGALAYLPLSCPHITPKTLYPGLSQKE